MKLGKLGNQDHQQGNDVDGKQGNVVVRIMSTQQKPAKFRIKCNNNLYYRIMGKAVKNLRLGVYWTPSSNCSQSVKA